MSGVSLCQGCPYVRGVLMSGVSLCQGRPYVRGVLMSGVSWWVGGPGYENIFTTDQFGGRGLKDIGSGSLSSL